MGNYYSFYNNDKKPTLTNEQLLEEGNEEMININNEINIELKKNNYIFSNFDIKLEKLYTELKNIKRK
jgi:hypothetical protein